MRVATTKRYAGLGAAALLVPALGAACSSSRVASTQQLLSWASQPRHREPAEPEVAADTVPREGAPDSPWTVDAILEEIRAGNPTLGEAQARLEQARAVRSESLGAYVPELSLGLDYVSTDNPARAFAILLDQQDLTLGPGFDATPGSLENWRKEVRLDWPLFAPGRDESRRAAGEGEEAARLAREAVERRLLNAGVQAWLGLRTARQLEDVARESIAVVQQRHEQTRRRHAEGAALRADVLRLEVRLAAARQEAAAARLAVSEAESSLNLLMGRPPGTPLPLAGEEVVIGAGLPLDLDLLYEQAEAGRLDLLAGAHGVRRAGFQREASRAERYPALRAFASYDIDGPEPALETDLDSYLVGVGLRLPISVSTSARIRQAEAREDELREELRSLALSVTREVRDAWEALEVARETLALARAAVDTAAEAFRIVAAAQDAGGATVTDVLEAEDARRKAQVRFVAARAAVEMVRARLVAATGGVR